MSGFRSIPCSSRLHVAPPFLPVHGPVQASKLQPGLVRTSNWQPSPVLSQEHDYVKTQACQTNMQTIITLSILTPAAMMRLSSVAKRPVQQAVVASHVAAESHHEGYKGIQWDVWLSRPSVNIFDCLLSFKLHQLHCCSKLLLKALFDRAHECEGLARRGFRRLLPKALAKYPNCPFSSQLRKYNRRCCPKLLFQARERSQADCATFGELPMSVVRSPPEALAKFPNCNLNVQLSEVPLLDGPA